MLLALLAPALAAAPAAPHFAGRPLPEALAQLESLGLSLVFSSDVVRSDMRVASEPLATAPRAILEELLAPHGLAAEDGPRGSLLIVPAAAAPAGESAGAASSPSPASPPLRPLRFRAEDVVVTSSGDEPPRPQAGDGTAIAGDDLRRDATLGDDVNRALARQPGAAAADLSAQLFVRGGEADEFATLLDGMPIREPYHLRSLMSPSGIIDASAVAGAELWTGNSGPEFGNSLSGVVSLTSLPPSDPSRYALSSSSMSTRFLGRGRFDAADGGWVLSARTWYPNMTTDFVAPSAEDFSPTFHDLFAKLERRVGDGTVISGDVLLSADDSHFIGDVQSERLRATSRYAWLNVKSALTEHLLSETMLSSTSIESGRDGWLGPEASPGAVLRDERAFSALGLKQDFSYEAAGHHLLRGGVSLEHGLAEYDTMSQAMPAGPAFGAAGASPAATAAPATLLWSPSGDSFGAYIADRYQVAPPLTVDFGLRWDRRSWAAGPQVSPRVNLLWALDRGSSVRAGWGRFTQAQGLDELLVQDGLRQFAPAESAEQWTLGFEQAVGRSLSFRVDAYRKSISDPLPRDENLFNPAEVFPEIAADRIRIAPSSAAARGIELSLKRDPSRGFGWWAAYALASAEDQIDGAWVPRSWDQRHTFNFGVDYRRDRAWDLTLAGLVHSGWPTTGVSAALVTNPDGSQTIQPILGPRNAERLPDYVRLDLKVRRSFAVGQGRLSLFASVTNLTNRANVAGSRGFTFTPRGDGTIQVDRQDVFWLGQTPLFGLEWESGP